MNKHSLYLQEAHSGLFTKMSIPATNRPQLLFH